MNEPPTLPELLGRMRTLPPMPAVVADLIASLDDDSISLEALANKISQDPALASRTLRMANSPFFGMSGQIASVRKATTVLGMQTIRSVTLASSVAEAMAAAMHSKIDIRAFWLHSFQTATAAKELARLTGTPSDQAFLAGLLHDLGQLVIAAVIPEIMTKLMTVEKFDEGFWRSAEHQFGLLGHAELGGALMRHWHFPEVLCRAVSNHHAPIPENDDLAAVVHVAELLSQAHAVASGRSSHIDAADERVWQHVAAHRPLLHRAAVALNQAEKLAALVA